MAPLLFLFACSSPAPAPAPAPSPGAAPAPAAAPAAYRSVETDALATALAAGTPPTVLDVRTPQEYAQGHVPGAKNIPVDTLADQLAQLDKAAEVYVICQSGRRSAAASSMLAERGYQPVNVTGGTAKWIAEGRPVEK